MNEIDEWLTLKQAAEIVGVTPRKYRTGLRTARLRAIRLSAGYA